MSYIKKTIGVVSLAVLIPLFTKNAYTQNSPETIEQTTRPKQVKKLTKGELESLKKIFNDFNVKIKKEAYKQSNINPGQNYIIQSHQLYNPEDIKLLYTRTHNFGEDEKKDAKWYVGGEFTRSRNIKNIQIGGEMGNFSVKAFIDPANNKRAFNFRTSKDKNSLEVIIGNNNLIQGKIKTTLPRIAKIDVFYDFNNKQFNYSISRSYKGVDFNIGQQFKRGVTITSANLSYALKGIGFPGKVKINYVLNDYKNRQKNDKLSIILQEKIGILNLESKLDKTPFGIIPSITGSINYSWD